MENIEKFFIDLPDDRSGAVIISIKAITKPELLGGKKNPLKGLVEKVAEFSAICCSANSH